MRFFEQQKREEKNSLKRITNDWQIVFNIAHSEDEEKKYNVV